MTGFFSTPALALFISPKVALLMILLLSNGLLAGGFAAAPVIPKESMDPIRFCSALSAIVLPLSPPFVAPRSPSVPLRLFMVRLAAGCCCTGGWGAGAAKEGVGAGGWGANGSEAGGAGVPKGS